MPKGFDSNFKVPPDWTFDLPSVMEGSVNSFLKGDFGYNVEDTPLFQSIEKGTPSPDNMKDLLDFKVDQKAAGFFNLPVCEVTDLHQFMLHGEYSPGVDGTITGCWCGKSPNPRGRGCSRSAHILCSHRTQRQERALQGQGQPACFGGHHAQRHHVGNKDDACQ